MIARGKRRAARGASPLDRRITNSEALKERNNGGLKFRTFSALSFLFLLTRGDVLRFATHLPLAIILRAFGAGVVLPIHFLSRILKRSFAVFDCTVG